MGRGSRSPAGAASHDAGAKAKTVEKVPFAPIAGRRTAPEPHTRQPLYTQFDLLALLDATLPGPGATAKGGHRR